MSATQFDPDFTKNAFRNYLKDFYAEHSRQMKFCGNTPELFGEWKESARQRVLELLSIDHLPVKTPEIQIIDEVRYDNYTMQKIQYQTLPELVVPAYLFIPENCTSPLPTLLCPPGHGNGINQVIEEEGAYYKYPHAFAAAGYIALVPEHISFGERSASGHGECGFDHEALNLLGSTVIGYRMWELQRSLDILESLPQVDSNRIGCAGLSLGGEMTLYLAACDPRIKAACVSCFLTSFKGTFLKEPHCTCGYVPKMARDFEHADIASLIAPNPLMIQAGTLDPQFLAEDATEAYTELSELYQMLDATDLVTLDIFEGGHEFHLDSALAWFEQWFRQ